MSDPSSTWTFRTLDYSYPGLFVPSMDYSYLGLFVPWTVRTLLDCSYHGLFVPSLDCSYLPGLFIPWTIRTITGRFVPCCQRQLSLYSVSQKIPPEVFWHFFQNGWEFWVQILHAYCTFIPTVEDKFLFNKIISNFEELRLYHIKCTGTGKLETRCARTIALSCSSVCFGRWWTFQHMMVVALNMAQLCQSCR